MLTSTCVYRTALVVGFTGLATAGSLFAAANSAFAATLDLSTWTPIGDTVTTIQPVTGAQVDLLSGFNNFFQSNGTISGAPAATLANLNTFLGSSISGTTGSAIKTVLNIANAGDALNFSYDFNAGKKGSDIAFLVVNGAITPFATTASATGSGALPFFSASQSGTYTYTFSVPGTYNIGLGVISEVSDAAGGPLGSGLGIAGANVQAVPEPSITLGMLGAGIVGAIQRRRQKKLEQ